MVKLVFLSAQFFRDYSNCKEILKKENHPYVSVIVQYNNVLFCVPMRSNINHQHAFFTDEANKCGLDFSKAVVITDTIKYIDVSKRPRIRPNEFKALKKVSSYELGRRLETYIHQYKKAKAAANEEHNQQLLACSTLQYFEEYI